MQPVALLVACVAGLAPVRIGMVVASPSRCTSLGAWIRASRLTSQSYILLPLLLGQALFVAEGGALSWPVFALAQLFGLFDQLYIVYANDFADVETDRLNQTATIFSGGSRVLVDGELRPAALLSGALLMAGLCLAVGVALWVFFGRALCLPLALAALLLLWLYSFGPARLSYRGGGELLQMLGVGCLLPLFGYYAQSGSWESFPWSLLSVLLPTHLAAALATTLPDQPSDSRSRKRTFAVLVGAGPAKAAMILLDLGACAALVVVSGGWSVELGWVLALPLTATLAQLGTSASKPGSPALTIHVALAILVTLSLVGGMAATALLRGGA